MTILKTTEQLQQWEKLVPFLGLNQESINKEFWQRAQHYKVLPNLHIIYSNLITCKIMHKLIFFNQKLNIGLEICGEKDLSSISHKDLAEMPIDTIKDLSTKVMLAIHDRYGEMERLLTRVGGKGIEELDIDTRIDVLKSQSKNNNPDTDWHGLSLLSLIKDQSQGALDIRLDNAETVLISDGDLYINGAFITSDIRTL